MEKFKTVYVNSDKDLEVLNKLYAEGWQYVASERVNIANRHPDYITHAGIYFTLKK